MQVEKQFDVWYIYYYRHFGINNVVYHEPTNTQTQKVNILLFFLSSNKTNFVTCCNLTLPQINHAQTYKVQLRVLSVRAVS